MQTQQVCTANRQVSVTKMNESELPTKCRKQSGDVETVQATQVRDKSSGGLVIGWAASGMRQHDRHIGSGTERGNLSSRCEGSDAKQKHCERLSTDAGHRGRWPRSSDEAPVMGVERRGSVVGVDLLVNRAIGMNP